MVIFAALHCTFGLYLAVDFLIDRARKGEVFCCLLHVGMKLSAALLIFVLGPSQMTWGLSRSFLQWVFRVR